MRSVFHRFPLAGPSLSSLTWPNHCAEWLLTMWLSSLYERMHHAHMYRYECKIYAFF